MDYKLSSVEELGKYISESPASRVSQILSHYRKTNNEVMVEKIMSAKKIAKKLKLIRKLEEM